ncbi:MAG: response regulator [Lachnospiraceae bacterium]|jgi:PAS domain S-box-containing protein|nr:response regulator [Lachnospiraceae bacterium]
MYHCHTRFYCISQQPELFQILQEMPPLEAFTHEFFQSSQAEAPLAQNADVILADFRQLNAAETIRLLIASKNDGADLIILAEKQQLPQLTEYLPDITDIWFFPMSEAELQFRFSKWQQHYRFCKNAWETNQFLESTINSVPNLIWYKDKDGVHEKVNDSFCQTVGKTKQQVQGRRHAYIWDVEQDDPACIESERIVMESKKTFVSEETIQTGEGMKLLTAYKSPLYDLDGSVMGTVGVAIDITKERAYAQELLQKNQTLELLFTTMDCGVMCHSLDGSHIISVNKAALRILGYASQEALVQSGFHMVASSVLPEDQARLQESISALKNVGDSVSVEYRVKHADGKILHVMGNIKIIEKNGELFYQRYLLDYTDQKLREEQVRSEDKRRQMELIHALSTEYSLVCFFDLDTGHGEALRINDCKNNILNDIFSGNLILEDCMKRYIDTAVHEEDKAFMQEATSRSWLEKELSEKTICHINYRTTCCGEIRYFQLKAVRSGSWDMNHGIVLGCRSIDEEMHKEREKQALLEDALVQANRASKAKSTFLSNMSHDIRTPMNAIIGFTTLAITHIEQRNQVEEYLKKIMTSGNHLLSLINDILDMSRIESGKIHLKEEPCSLPDILHGLHNIIQADIHAKQLDLYMDAVDVQNEDICCDRLRLNQVLLNLLSNSIKYTAAGGMVSVKVIEKAGAPAGYASYEFHVKDTGIGMSEQFISHIFEPFERERNSTISGIQGTGLGMAITKNIIDMMNGSIEIKSKQGFGTECIVSLTFRLHGGEKEPRIIPELKGLRALVVDDDFNTCDSVSWMLHQIGLRAEWTLSGKEAVLRTRQASMRDDRYFVYIIDWLLPDMNGIEVARRIRQEIGDEVPIIVLTAYDWSDIEEEARQAGVNAFCSKPLFLSELKSCLQSVLHQDQNAEPASPLQIGNHSGRILLTDDNDLNLEIAQAILEEAGFSVETAANGQIAVDMLKASQPGYYQLILMDVQMPVMNGYEATIAIRKLEDPALASIPILAMTANAFDEDKQAALQSGMNGHIAKPIDIDKLIQTLEEVLD